MSRWLPRSLWLLAWSFWVWLGFGLYRELPREPGAAVSSLRLEDFESYCGPLDDRLAVTQINTNGVSDCSRFRTRDISSGLLIHEWKGPLNASPSWEMLRLGFVAGINKDAIELKSEAQPFQLLDLRTGEWTPLGSMFLTYPHEHPTRPWFAIWEGGGGELELFVYDVSAKKQIFKGAAEMSIAAAPRSPAPFGSRTTWSSS